MNDQTTQQDRLREHGLKGQGIIAELFTALKIKREKLEVAEASKQELLALLVTLASEASAKVKEADELRKQMDEIAEVLECPCCFEKMGAGCEAFGCGHIFCNQTTLKCGAQEAATCPQCREPVTPRVQLFGVISHGKGEGEGEGDGEGGS